MEVTRRTIAAALFMVALSFVASDAADAGTVSLVDQAGRSVAITRPVKRVVSLAPSVTEIVFAVGGSDLLKGATRFSDTPKDALALPRVGTYARPNVERIAALNPDLVIGVRDGNPLWTVDALERLSIPFFVVYPKDVEGLLAAIRLVGGAIGREAEGAAVADRLAGRIAAVAGKVRGAPRVRVFVQAGLDPLVAAGGGTYINDVVRLAGGENVFEHIKGWPKLNAEAVLKARPEVFIIVYMGRDKNPGRARDRWLGWPEIPAVRAGRVHLVESNLYCRPSPRVAELLEEVAGLLHPEIFGGAE